MCRGARCCARRCCPRSRSTAIILLMVVAIFGTTISPYLFFWQASQEAEESRLSHRARYRVRANARQNAFRQIALDTWVGMAVSNVIAFFIIVTTAATLTRMASPRSTPRRRPPKRCGRSRATSPSRCLRRASSARGCSRCRCWRARRPTRWPKPSASAAASNCRRAARIGFYAIVGAATLGGAALAATKIDPIAMLFWAAVLNGVVSVPIMAAMMLTVSGEMRDKAGAAALAVLARLGRHGADGLGGRGLCRRLADGLRRVKPRRGCPPRRR